jgi:hypothetical protein
MAEHFLPRSNLVRSIAKYEGHTELDWKGSDTVLEKRSRCLGMAKSVSPIACRATLTACT